MTSLGRLLQARAAAKLLICLPLVLLSSFKFVGPSSLPEPQNAEPVDGSPLFRRSEPILLPRTNVPLTLLPRGYTNSQNSQDLGSLRDYEYQSSFENSFPSSRQDSPLGRDSSHSMQGVRSQQKVVTDGENSEKSSRKVMDFEGNSPKSSQGQLPGSSQIAEVQKAEVPPESSGKKPKKNEKNQVWQRKWDRFQKSPALLDHLEDEIYAVMTALYNDPKTKPRTNAFGQCKGAGRCYVYNKKAKCRVEDPTHYRGGGSGEVSTVCHCFTKFCTRLEGKGLESIAQKKPTCGCNSDEEWFDWHHEKEKPIDVSGVEWYKGKGGHGDASGRKAGQEKEHSQASSSHSSSSKTAMDQTTPKAHSKALRWDSMRSIFRKEKNPGSPKLHGS